jgi:hypothetical protein
MAALRLATNVTAAKARVSVLMTFLDRLAGEWLSALLTLVL